MAKVQLQNGTENVYPVIESAQVISELKDLSFNNGAAFVSFKPGYRLVSAVVVDRPSTESGTYAITNIYGRTDTYRLQNIQSNLTASVNVILTWVAVS